VNGVDHRDQGIEPGVILQAVALFVHKREGLGHRQGLGDARRFDQQIVVFTGPGQFGHLHQQIIAQSAADAAVGHFDQFLVGTLQGDAAVLGQGRVDVDLAHVIDDQRDAFALAIGEDVVEQSSFAGSKKAGEDGNRKAFISHKGLWVMIMKYQ